MHVGRLGCGVRVEVGSLAAPRAQGSVPRQQFLTAGIRACTSVVRCDVRVILQVCAPQRASCTSSSQSCEEVHSNAYHAHALGLRGGPGCQGCARGPGAAGAGGRRAALVDTARKAEAARQARHRPHAEVVLPPPPHLSNANDTKAQ